jgi:hypothetical protein
MRLVSDLLEREDVMTTQRYTKVLENQMPQGMQKTHLFRGVMFPADAEVGGFAMKPPTKPGREDDDRLRR